MAELADPRSPDGKLRSIRGRLLNLMQAHKRHLIVLAVDGIPATLACKHWANARIDKLQSEFPTTSSTCWMSATTGLSPVEHGAVGYMQRFQPDTPATRVFDTCASTAFPPMDTVFSDATALGYRPICLDSDFCTLPGQWRDAVVSGANAYIVGPFYADDPAGADPNDVLNRLDIALNALLQSDQPALIWCYIDVDLYIHLNGYDAKVTLLLDGLEDLAQRACAIADVVGISDHGLVPTNHEPEISKALEGIGRAFGAEMAGAGRTRWFHVHASQHATMKAALQEQLPDCIQVHDRSDLFPPGPFHDRVGELVVMATGPAFVTDPNYTYDHGSWSETEVRVPWAHWAYRGG